MIFCALCIPGEKTSPGEDLFETLLFYIPLCIIGPCFFRRAMANLYLEFSWGISNYHQHILSFLSFIHLLHTASLTPKRFSLYRAYFSFCPFFAFWLWLVRGNALLIGNNWDPQCVLNQNCNRHDFLSSETLTNLSLIFFETMALLKVSLHANEN